LLEHESAIVNQRLEWLSAFEGLLFTAFGFLAPKEASSAVNPELATVVCWAGLCVAFVSYLALLASAKATYRLLNWWESNQPAAYDGPGVIGWALPKRPWASYVTVWNFLPLIVSAAWIALIFALRKYR
jgi:hypothetical protein